MTLPVLDLERNQLAGPTEAGKARRKALNLVLTHPARHPGVCMATLARALSSALRSPANCRRRLSSTIRACAPIRAASVVSARSCSDHAKQALIKAPHKGTAANDSHSANRHCGGMRPEADINNH